MMSGPERVIASGDAKSVKRESARRTRRSFLVGGAAAAAGYGAFHWINNSQFNGRLQIPLRDTLNFNADVNRAVFDERGLAPEYPLSEAKPLRINGNVGLEDVLMASGWRLQLAGVANPQSSPLYAPDVTAWEYKYGGEVPMTQQSNDVKSAPGNGDKSKTGKDTRQSGPTSLPAPAQQPTPQPSSELNPTGAVDSAAGAALAARIEAMTRSKKRYEGDAEAGPSASGLDIGTPGLLLAMGDLMKLPKVEFVTQFKCIEGWSNITQWGGVRLRDLLEMYPPAKVNGRDPKYVYMETPNGDYYGGYDLAIARHPQTLLVTEMGGQPLTQDHGAPLRLHTPLKYGYKQIKRIGLIAYTDSKPDDYWTKLGYDWYAGL
jgi:hypothetical protein